MKSFLKKILVVGLFLTPLASCEALGNVGEGVADFFGGGGDYVIVDSADPTASVGESMSSPGDIPSVVFGAIMKILIGFVPALAGWEGILALLFRRKRQHYVRALKAVIPMDKTVDLGGAASAVSAALGLTHSSEGSEAVFEEELEEEE